MFSFFKKSKKDSDKKNRDQFQNKESKSQQGENPGKNNRDEIVNKSASESDSEPLPNNFSESETVPRKNVPNAATSAVTESEKTDANPDIIATMSQIPVETPKKPPPFGAKPCGHGTTPISPRVPPAPANRSNNSTPTASPVLELRKHFRISGIENVTSHPQGKTNDMGGENTVIVSDMGDENTVKINDVEGVNTVKVNDKGVTDTVAGRLKLHVSLPTPAAKDQNNTKNLVNQEAKFQSQLNDLSKQLSIRDAEANKLKFQMEELQRDVFAKSAGMDRLESELSAAQKECETIRQRIRVLENELDNQKRMNSQLSTDISEKTDAFQSFERDSKYKIEELEDTIKGLRIRIDDLENQLKSLREEKEHLEKRHTELLTERDEEKKKIAETLEQAQIQRQDIEKKWKEDFEKLRTINIMKEQETLDDFEWKLREVQQKCKARLEEKDKVVEEKLQEAYRTAEEKMKQAQEMTEKLENLKVYETEIENLRSLTTGQKEAMNNLIKQQEEMKQTEESLKNETKKLRNLMEMEKENLQHMQRMHHQDILDKERQLKQTLNDKRTEIAMYWEERLLNECGRLKVELEQIHDEEKWNAMESVRKAKDEAFQKAQKHWDTKLGQCLKEVSSLKKSLAEKDKHYKEEMVSQQTETDRELMELRRLMDKIDMMHHEKYEKLVSEHDSEIDRINLEHEMRVQETENYWKTQISSLRISLEAVKEQMEKESQQKMEGLIEQHRTQLDEQWDNLIHQKSEAIQLLEEEYISKYRTLEEQFYTQQKSHSLREVELLKTIDSLKHELQSKESTIEDLQNNVDTLEGGVQVLNQEIAQQCEDIAKARRESDQKIKGLLETLAQLQEGHEKESETYRLKFLSSQKQSQETIDHLQKKCQCLTKLFEEVRQRYERRESRQEDINKIADLKQVIAEQEKDLACINEEKRYFQMKLIALEKHLEENVSAEEEEFEDAHAQPLKPEVLLEYAGSPNSPISIPPTIPECDE
ncbi:unnamed protein product [Phaedon cochleariae]|uniref:Uncharacterized protein n=1 Tax=Phaedon cochleariae TaxID=80249 RepID=A0A9N9X4R8_PHACE|nr:unnamed protein product [Phaedon cochleariae]